MLVEQDQGEGELVKLDQVDWNLEKLFRHVLRFFPNKIEAIRAIGQIVEENPQVDKAEIFRQVTEGKGPGKSHVSRFQQACYDYKPKKR
ncbi:hypothetical protein A2Z22_00105 [Candidatus Woesebacteria bacterium RBG_16_34_12]|uniref:Uncharacterized protein n=1 Tax=Candidatus Woesebacteria bacterium RBG_16_34_12 TaxID=1802480 RepID=A0A1F7X9Y5_9BACT|nr:MAG: hypothetical protein A2Z22_00105 [Candidatus Woesebacteria bacterium RBG_16_34_12]